MTIFDIIISTVIISSTLLGLYRGAIHILINLLGFVASIFLAFFFYDYARIILIGYVSNDLALSIFSAVASYILSLIIFTFIASRALSALSVIRCGPIDRVLGFVLGGARGCLFSLIIFTIVAIFTAGTYSEAEKIDDLIHNLEREKYPEWLQSSFSTEYMEISMKEVILYTPEEWINTIELPKPKKQLKEKKKRLLDDNEETETVNFEEE